MRDLTAWKPLLELSFAATARTRQQYPRIRQALGRLVVAQEGSPNVLDHAVFSFRFLR